MSKEQKEPKKIARIKKIGTEVNNESSEDKTSSLERAIEAHALILVPKQNMVTDDAAHPLEKKVVETKSLPPECHEEIKRQVKRLQSSPLDLNKVGQRKDGKQLTKYDKLLISLTPRMREIILDEIQKTEPDEKLYRVMCNISVDDINQKAYELGKICLDQVLSDMLAEHIEKLKSEHRYYEAADATSFAAAMAQVNQDNKALCE